MQILNDKSLQLDFSKYCLCNFLITRNEFPVISDLAILIVLAVCTTYWCVAEFSKLIIIKSKYRCVLKYVQNVFLPALANFINLQMDDLRKNHQVHHAISCAAYFYQLKCFLLIFFALLFPLRSCFTTV